MDLVFGQDETVAQLVAKELGINFCPPFVAIGIEKDGSLIGGFVYNNYNKHNIEISWYGPGTLQRHILRAAFYNYPFAQLNVLRLTAATKRSNKLVCRLLPRLGFTYEATLKNYFGPAKSDDAIVYRLTEQDAQKWKGKSNEG